MWSIKWQTETYTTKLDGRTQIMPLTSSTTCNAVLSAINPIPQTLPSAPQQPTYKLLDNSGFESKLPDADQDICNLSFKSEPRLSTSTKTNNTANFSAHILVKTPHLCFHPPPRIQSWASSQVYQQASDPHHHILPCSLDSVSLCSISILPRRYVFFL